MSNNSESTRLNYKLYQILKDILIYLENDKISDYALISGDIPRPISILKRELNELIQEVKL